MTATHRQTDPPQAPSATRTDEPPSFGKMAMMLAAIGVAFGAPSFMIARKEFDDHVLFFGVGVIFVSMLIASRTNFGKQRLCDRALTLSIVTVLFIRIVTIPFGWVLDVLAGFIVLEFMQDLGPGHKGIAEMGILETLTAVFIQAAIVIGAFAWMTLLIYPIHRNRLLKKDKSGLCIRCGYDLRATRDRCPECGSNVPVGHQPSQPVRDADSLNDC